MVAAGVGITVLPATAITTPDMSNKLLRYIPFEKPAPLRRVVLAWRKSFTRVAAVQALAETIYATDVQGVKMLRQEPAVQ